MTRLLSLFGLMRVSEHEMIVADNDEKAYSAWAKMADERDDMKMWRDDWQQKHNSVGGKLKKAVADLERAVSRNQELMFEKGQLAAANSSLRSEINDLRPDALAMRRKRQMDRNRRKGNG